MAHFLGPSLNLDIYYASFKVPDFIFISIASLASVTVLVPFVLSKMKKEETLTKDAKIFLNHIFTVFSFFLILTVLVAFIFMPSLVHLVVPGFDASSKREVIFLSRVMLLSPLFLGISNLFGSITQIFRKFFSYALSPIFYNFGIIAGVVFFYPVWGVSGIAFGVVLGAFAHLIIQGFASWKCGFAPRFAFDVSWKEIREVVEVSLPRTLGLAMNSIAIIFIASFASYLLFGSISVFTFAYNLQTTPLGIIGLSFAVAAFPTLSKSFASGDLPMFKSHLKEASRAVIFWSMPVAFLFIVLRAQIVRVVLGTGAFSWEDTRLVAASLAIFSLSIVAQGLIALFARAYYAGGNTKKPLYVNLICSSFIVLFAFGLLKLWDYSPAWRYFIESLLKVNDITGTKVLMLPLAYTLGTILNFILLWIFIRKDFMHKEHFIFKSFFQSLAASFFIGFVAYGALNILAPIFGTSTFWGILAQGFFAGVFGILVGVFVLYLLKNEELKDLVRTLKTKFWKGSFIAPTQDTL